MHALLLGIERRFVYLNWISLPIQVSNNQTSQIKNYILATKNLSSSQCCVLGAADACG